MHRISVYHGRTGAGKSQKLKKSIIGKVGRHLLVVPRRRSVDECYVDLSKVRAQLSTGIKIHKFKSADGKKQKAKIAKQIEDCVASYESEDEHCVIIITQAAFLMLDPALFAGWHVMFDELLAGGNLSGPLFAPVMWKGYQNLFTITPLKEEDIARCLDPSLHRICAVPGVEAKDLMVDALLSDADRSLYQRASTAIPVYTDATCLEDIGRRRCRWCSPWTLDQTDGFGSVEIAACDIEESLMHKLSPRLYDMVQCGGGASLARVRVFYFDAGAATCSAAYWQDQIGARNLALVGKEIARRGGVDFWTCNESGENILKPIMPRTSIYRVEDDLYPADGTWIRQQQDGTNYYRKCLSCAILISSKAQEHEAIFELINPAATKQAISRSREDSLIFQFVSRGAIRMKDFAGEYVIFVYDRQQAEALQAKLFAYDYPDTTIEHIAIEAFTERVHEPKGRKPTYATPEEREIAKRQQGKARQQRMRAKNALRAASETTERVLAHVAASISCAGQGGSHAV